MLLGIYESYDSDRFWPITIMGSLTLIPGGYYTWILICIWVRVPGYTNDDIPDFN